MEGESTFSLLRANNRRRRLPAVELLGLAVVAVVIQFISAFEAELGPVTVVELELGLGSETGSEVEVEPGTGTIWRLSGFIVVVVVAVAAAVSGDSDDTQGCSGLPKSSIGCST